MDNNTKSLLKSTIMGLVSGGALSALYALHKNKADEKDSKESHKNEITVPLSRRNFMKALGKGPAAKGTETSSAEASDVSKMTPQELAALKKALLRKSAEKKASALPTKIEEKTGPALSTSQVRKAKKANYATLRNGKGQFSTEKNLSKAAGIGADALGTMLDTAGGVGGFMVGMAAVKHIADRILVNRKRRQLEKSRQTYVDMLNKEVNDEDTPYYKKASDRGGIGTALGLAGMAGIGTAGIAGLVVYRIMENRRKEEEKDLDKDLSKFPQDKTIKYKFASEQKTQNGSDRFFA